MDTICSITDVITVSYTHLDVYKRQLHVLGIVTGYIFHFFVGRPIFVLFFTLFILAFKGNLFSAILSKCSFHLILFCLFFHSNIKYFTFFSDYIASYYVSIITTFDYRPYLETSSQERLFLSLVHLL